MLSLPFMQFLTLIIMGALSLTVSSTAHAGETTVADYGDLYMSETKQAETLPWQVGAAYSYELSNPYLNVNGVNVSGARNLNRYLGAGLQVSRFFTSQTAVTSAVEKNLNSDGITQTVRRPSYSLYGTVAVTPLSGRLNLFSATAMPFDLVVTAGGGTVSYLGLPNTMAMLWSVAPQIMATKNLGLSVSIGQEIEDPFSRNSFARLEGKVGTFVRF